MQQCNKSLNIATITSEMYAQQRQTCTVRSVLARYSVDICAGRAYFLQADNEDYG